MMVYLLLGESSQKKSQRITDIREKILPTADARQFDYEVLDAKKITPAILKERLLALPTSAPRRLIVLQEVQHLPEATHHILIEVVSAKPDHLVLIMTAESMPEKSGFTRQLRDLVQVVNFGQTKGGSVFDLTRAIDRRQQADALACLSGLLNEGQHPLQLIPGIIWFWRQKQGRIPDLKFSAGLVALQEADLNIKRSRIPPEYAMEMLVVKLGMLLA